jgi:hypothetical protein
MDSSDQDRTPVPSLSPWWTVLLIAAIGFVVWRAMKRKGGPLPAVAVLEAPLPPPLVSPWNPLP